MLNNRNITSGPNNCFDKYNSFQDYLEKTSEIVSQTQNSTLNIPFELRPGFKTKKGILIVHGLFDSPYGMKYLAEYFKKKGFLVRTILLPGHGTSPKDLLNVNYKEWINAVEFGIDSFQGEVEDLYCAGLSIGAALCINLYLKNKELIKGLFLFSPAIRLRQKIYLSRFLKFVNLKWINKGQDKDPIRYESRPLNSVLQTISLLKENELLLKKESKFNIPMFIVLTEDDETLDIKNTLSILRAIKNNQISIFLFSENIKTKNTDIKRLKSIFPQQNIVSLSHSCLVMSQDDPIHGINGSHGPYNHFHRGQENQKMILGAATKANLKRYRLFRKLTFNPGLKDIFNNLDKFIDSKL